MANGDPFENIYRDGYTGQTYSDISVPDMRTPLTVDEIERLAKAGVKIELKDVNLQPEHIPPPPRTYSLTDELYKRWDLAQANYASTRDGYFPMGFNPNEVPFARRIVAHAMRHGETVYVMIASSQNDNIEPHIITDESRLFPSDALLAKIALMLETAGTKL